MKTKKRKGTRLKQRFSFERPKNGQLVITAQIAVVTNSRWGVQNMGYEKGRYHIEVRGLHPKGGRHIVRFGSMGQQCVMILKRGPQ